MNAALSFPRSLRHPSWYIPLLLPVLPILVALCGAFERLDALMAQAGAMTALGLLLTFGLRATHDRVSSLVRKEIDQLRHAWLLGLFVAQTAMFQSSHDTGPIASVLTGLVCGLLAALSFGIEFQQRTMPSLLCLPVNRLRLWRIKMAVLGVALISLLVVFATSIIVGGAESSMEDAGMSLLAAAGLAIFAWATVPLWTLLTRNLLAGFVFALAVPALTLAVVSFSSDWLGLGLHDAIPSALLGAYVLSSPVLSWLRWNRLEAPDAAESDLGGLFLASRARSGRQAGATVGGWRWALLGKELRIQTVTLICLATAVAVMALAPFANSGDLREFLNLLGNLFAATALLLAGATPIAEERRLGTLDGHVLLPVSRSVQWWIKFVSSLGIAVAAIALVALRSGGGMYLQDLSFVPFAALTALFILSFFASSGTPNSLRALLFGLVFTGIASGLVALVGQLGVEMIQHFGMDQWRALEDPVALLSVAQGLSGSQIATLNAHAQPPPLSLILPIAAGIACSPALLALAFAYRNFRHPAAGASHLGGQFLGILGAILLAGGAILGPGCWLQHRTINAQVLLLGRKTIDLEQSLSPAQLRLRKHSYQWRGGAIGPEPERISFAARVHPRRAEYRNVTLPLSRADRNLVIRTADIPAEIREALRLEAVAEGDTTVPDAPFTPPEPEASGDNTPEGAPFPISPEMARRYGLIPSASAATRGANPAGRATPAGAASGITNDGSAPGEFKMSPELMKRYGLIPAIPSSSTSSVPATTNPVAP